MTHRDNIAAWLGEPGTPTRDACDRLLGQVADMRADNVVYPEQDAILRALELCGPTDTRVVILGQDPYHEPGQAMGLSFSVPEGCRLPPSLRNVYTELAADLGCEMPATGDLTPWARQGVLLLNTTLTVVEHKANSHARLGWQQVTGHVVRRCLELPQPVVFMCWGRFAGGLVADAADEVAGGTPPKFRLCSTHPSPLSARRATDDLAAFVGSRPFSAATRLLEENGATPVDWACLG